MPGACIHASLWGTRRWTCFSPTPAVGGRAAITPLKKYRQISREEKPLSQGRSPAQCTWNLDLPAPPALAVLGLGNCCLVCIGGFFILGCTLDVRFAPPRPFSVELMGKLRPGRVAPQGDGQREGRCSSPVPGAVPPPTGEGAVPGEGLLTCSWAPPAGEEPAAWDWGALGRGRGGMAGTGLRPRSCGWRETGAGGEAAGGPSPGPCRCAQGRRTVLRKPAVPAAWTP